MASFSNAPPGTLIADRYRVESTLGRGGMAVVYRVRDTREHRLLALKHLLGNERHGDKFMQLFQREYQTLVQLAHPRIVRAHEYGIASGSPYYTMELLDGADLSSGAPYEWRTACAILRDAASALAVIHSRRFVHRDVKAGNVRLTEDGRAKLIDFGALLPMGVASGIVGTLPFVSPEAFHKQPLDGRADLYSLGALAYWMLTGRHAYPARELSQLRDLWRTRPRSPEQIAKDVPPGLGALVMSLLSVDMLARPTNASELMDRLGALADLPAGEELGSARAYLVTPTLTGREAELVELRVKLAQGMHGRGSAVCIEGDAGVGRSRLLASFALEARIQGMTVISSDAGDAGGDFGTMRALIARLLEALPASAASLPSELTELAPSTRSTAEVGKVPAAAVQRLRADGRSALVRFILQQTHTKPLFIAVDDVQFCDGVSCAALAELSRAAPASRLVLALTAREADPDQEESLRVLRRAAPSLRLSPLSVEQTEALMRSVFGNATNLPQLASWMHSCAQGYPGAIMTLAQHLFDQGHARYQAGRWVLPADPHSLGVADALREALRGRVDALSDRARQLAQALALTGDRGSTDMADFGLLLDEDDANAGYSAVAELVAADVLREHGRAYVFSQPALGAIVRESLDVARERPLHLRLAAIYQMPSHRDTFMAAYHLQRAGELDRAQALLVARAQQLTTVTDPGGGPIKVRYRLAGETYLGALEHCQRSGGSVSDRFALWRGLLFVGGQYDPNLAYRVPGMLEQLLRDAGLVHHRELPELEPMPRLMRCFALAEQRYKALPEHERGLPVGEAVRALAFAVVMLSNAYGRALDADGMRVITAAMEPLRALSSTLDVIGELLSVSCAACSGLEASERCAALLARGETDPELTGNRVVQRLLTTMRYYLGSWEARRGGERALGHAHVIAAQRRQLETQYPADVGLGRYHSWHIRLLTHLYNGDVTRAHLCREQIDLLRLDGLDPVIGPAIQSSVFMEARAYAIADSVIELKGAVETMAELAQRTETWQPMLHWARGQYHRQLGDWESARVELEQALASTAPGRHLAWSWAAPALVEVLLGARQYEQALAFAQRAAAQFDTLPVAIPIRRDMQRVLALARAHAGDAEGAAAQLDALLPQAAKELGGVPLGQLYEARAQIAVLAGDTAAFASHAQRALELYRPGRHPGLLARHARLIELGRRAFPNPWSAADAPAVNDALHLVSSMLESCRDAGARASAALGLLIEHSGACSGYLFAVKASALELTASSDGTEPPAELVRRLQALLDRDNDDVTAVLQDSAPAAGGVPVGTGAVYHCVELRGNGNGEPLFTAIAALAADGEEAPRVSFPLVRAISDYLRDAGDLPSFDLIA